MHKRCRLGVCPAAACALRAAASRHNFENTKGSESSDALLPPRLIASSTNVMSLMIRRVRLFSLHHAHTKDATGEVTGMRLEFYRHLLLALGQ
jgi:hypothetical protein